MGKISEKKYAIALLESIKGKDKKQTEEIIKNFILILKKNNKLSSINKIMWEFDKVYDYENSIVNAEVTTTIEIDKNQKQDIEDLLKKKTKAKTINIENTISKKILGGIIIKYGDRIIDASLRTKLNNLKIELSK